MSKELPKTGCVRDRAVFISSSEGNRSKEADVDRSRVAKADDVVDLFLLEVESFAMRPT